MQERLVFEIPQTNIEILAHAAQVLEATRGVSKRHAFPNARVMSVEARVQAARLESQLVVLLQLQRPHVYRSIVRGREQIVALLRELDVKYHSLMSV